MHGPFVTFVTDFVSVVKNRVHHKDHTGPTKSTKVSSRSLSNP